MTLAPVITFNGVIADLHFKEDRHGEEDEDGANYRPLEVLQHVHQQDQELEDDALVLRHRENKATPECLQNAAKTTSECPQNDARMIGRFVFAMSWMPERDENSL